ncbi:hypothetical protein HPB50_000969 [Hyalomma asiaticum]|uniref:Uncharacterized protein n=1 Tax=Hyalomma asiaticum TaxID=266040 RepID=A0ACB7TCX7_HYAAI|nr:hypothetical protein HPB50_000969 [Hyalomma asiaticum]
MRAVRFKAEAKKVVRVHLSPVQLDGGEDACPVACHFAGRTCRGCFFIPAAGCPCRDSSPLPRAKPGGTFGCRHVTSHVRVGVHRVGSVRATLPPGAQLMRRDVTPRGPIADSAICVRAVVPFFYEKKRNQHPAFLSFLLLAVFRTQREPDGV